MRALKWTGYISVLLAAIATAVLIMLFTTVAGVSLALNIATRMLPGLGVDGWSGALAGTICIDTLDYRTEARDIHIQDACVNLNLWQSLDALEVSVHRLSASRIDIQPLASAPPADPAQGYAPALPVVIKLDVLTVDHFQFADFVLSAITGSAALDADQAELDLSLNYASYGIDVRAEGSWSELAVDAVLQIPESVALQGRVDLSRPELPYSAQLQAAALDLQRWTARPLQLQQPRVALTGNLQTYSFELTTRATDEILGQTQLRSSGDGDARGLVINAQMMVNPDLGFVDQIEQLDLNGRISWSPEISFDLQADTSALTVSFPGLTTTIGGEVQIAGTPTDIAIRASDLEGVLNDYPLSGAGSMRWHNDTALIESIDLRLGQGQLSVSGTVMNNQSIRLQAQGKRVPLPIIDSRLGGEASGSLTLTDYPEAPEISLALTTSNASFENFHTSKLALDYTGTLAGGRLKTSLQHELGRLDSLLQLQREQDTVTADIETLDATYTDASLGESVTLELRRPTHLQYSAGAVILEQACFDAHRLDSLGERSGTSATACMDLRYPDGPAMLVVDDLALPMIPLSASGTAVRANVNAKLRLDAFAPPEGSAELNLLGLVIHIDDVTRELGDLHFALALDSEQALVSISSPAQQALVSRGEITATLAPELMQSRLSGEVAVNIDGIRLVNEFLPMEVAYEISGLTGQLEVEAALEGTLQAPLVDARVIASDAGWQINASGTRFNNVGMTAGLQDSSRLELEVMGGVGGGSFALDGTLTDLGGEQSRLDTQVRLNDARVLELPDYTATLSGELQLAMTQAAIDLSGKLEMPSARIVIAELPETAVAVSEDAVIAGAQETRTTQQVRTTDINLKLGDDVRLSAFGLNTRLIGSLTLTETPGRLPDLRGKVTLRDGVFEAYGQKLKVERGELTFIGPVDDPVISLTASKVVERLSGDVTVSIVLTGTAKAIETEIRADPAMPEGDALALLLTGRTLSEMTSGEQTNVYGAAIALGLYGASGVTRSLAATMGLEEIIVGQDEQGAWEVGAAVRLQQNLYLRYTYGVFSRLGGVLLRYRLTDRVSVQAKAGDTQSIEIRYGVD